MLSLVVDIERLMHRRYANSATFLYFDSGIGPVAGKDDRLTHVGGYGEIRHLNYISGKTVASSRWCGVGVGSGLESWHFLALRTANAFIYVIALNKV